MWPSVGLVIFALATPLVAYLSRASLLRPRTHGFYRFFVFEAIIGLILISVPNWFRDAFSWHQIASWILLLISFIPLVLGVRALHTEGSSDARVRRESELLDFERTSRLVRGSIFRYIRHPMYSSLLLLAWGLFFKHPSTAGATLAVLASGGLMIMARIEEAECQRVFGAEYREYMRHTKRFIPLVF